MQQCVWLCSTGRSVTGVTSDLLGKAGLCKMSQRWPLIYLDLQVLGCGLVYSRYQDSWLGPGKASVS